MGRGYLISFEGLDGSGKTTQLTLLENWLIEHNIPYLRTREPGGTPLGVEIRRLLLHLPELGITPLAEAFLFQVDRAQHFAQVVLPALAEGKIVICDRSIDSSIAYQGAGRGLDPKQIAQLSFISTQGHKPDLTILLDLDPQEVATRTSNTLDESGQRERPNHFDTETLSFHERLRSAFLEVAQAEPDRVRVLDAMQPSETIHKTIIGLLKKRLNTIPS